MSGHVRRKYVIFILAINRELKVWFSQRIFLTAARRHGLAVVWGLSTAVPWFDSKILDTNEFERYHIKCLRMSFIKTKVYTNGQLSILVLGSIPSAHTMLISLVSGGLLLIRNALITRGICMILDIFNKKIKGRCIMKSIILGALLVSLWVTKRWEARISYCNNNQQPLPK